jgi:FAD/FMN-containing dehydrogenase
MINKTRRKLLKHSALGLSLAFGPKWLAAAQASENEDVIFISPQDPLYGKFSTPFNKRIKTRPSLIAVCKSEKGVQQAIAEANKQRLPVAVKSGGHSFEGFSLNENGMVIELSLMNGMSLSTDNIFTAMPGCKLAQVYDFMLPRKRIVPTGSCGGVGLAGLTLGGGYGLFSRKWGLTCDNLIGLRMVDASGKIHDTNDNKELLWACRGGGNGHFGVVTELRYRTHQSPEIFQRYRIKFKNLKPQDATALCQKWFSETRALPGDVFSAFVLNGSNLTILLTYFDEKSSAAVDKVALALSAGSESMPPKQSHAIAIAVTKYYGRSDPLPFKNSSAGFYNDFDDLKDGITDIFTAMAGINDLIFQINTLGGAIADASKIDTAAYPHRMLPYLGELQSYWDDEAQEPKYVAAFDGIMRKLSAMGIKRHYGNYPCLEIANWKEAYYGANYQRLQKLKALYDPQNLIRHAQSVET